MPKGIYDHKKNFVLTPKRLENLLKIGFKKGNNFGEKNKGVVRSEEYKKNASIKHKGKRYSPKTEFKKGGVNYWLGKKRPSPIEEARMKISLALKGRKVSEEHRAKMRENSPRGENHWNYKGGITPIREIINHSFEYRRWRSDIFTRDEFTCQKCGVKGGYLEADHYPKKFSEILKEYQIKSLQEALNCAELWNINNGRTLCGVCHRGVKKGSLKKDV